MKRRFSRAVFRRILKPHLGGLKLGRNGEIMAFLQYSLFLKALAVEANIEAQRMRSSIVSTQHVELALPRVLRRFAL